MTPFLHALLAVAKRSWGVGLFVLVVLVLITLQLDTVAFDSILFTLSKNMLYLLGGLVAGTIIASFIYSIWSNWSDLHGTAVIPYAQEELPPSVGWSVLARSPQWNGSVVATTLASFVTDGLFVVTDKGTLVPGNQPTTALLPFEQTLYEVFTTACNDIGFLSLAQLHEQLGELNIGIVSVETNNEEDQPVENTGKSADEPVEAVSLQPSTRANWYTLQLNAAQEQFETYWKQTVAVRRNGVGVGVFIGCWVLVGLAAVFTLFKGLNNINAVHVTTAPGGIFIRDPYSAAPFLHSFFIAFGIFIVFYLVGTRAYYRYTHEAGEWANQWRQWYRYVRDPAGKHTADEQERILLFASGFGLIHHGYHLGKESEQLLSVLTSDEHDLQEQCYLLLRDTQRVRSHRSYRFIHTLTLGQLIERQATNPTTPHTSAG